MQTEEGRPNPLITLDSAALQPQTGLEPAPLESEEALMVGESTLYQQKLRELIHKLKGRVGGLANLLGPSDYVGRPRVALDNRFEDRGPGTHSESFEELCEL